MQYFSGFGLHNDYALFTKLLHDFGYKQNLYDIVGFSSGALLALQHAMQRIEQKQRIGKLILISPLLYTHHISQDSIINMKTSTKHFHKPSKHSVEMNLLFKLMPCITHTSFHIIAKEFSDTKFLWNLFLQACIHSYKNDKLNYCNKLYKQIGFDTTLPNRQPNKHQCNVFTHFENVDVLRNMWNIGLIDFDKIQQKSQMFVIIMAEHDRITNSKIISEYLSQFGICYILKGCNHILQRDTSIKYSMETKYI